jgi:hypothetical protein
MKSNNGMRDRFVEEVIISIIGASIFSYGMVQTLTLFSQSYIGSSPYNVPLDAPLIEHIWNHLRLYSPIALILLIDALLFLFIIKRFFLPITRNQDHPIGYRKIIAYLFVIIPASATPWPIQRIFTAALIEHANWEMHGTPFLMWFALTLVCIFTSRQLEKKKITETLEILIVVPSEKEDIRSLIVRVSEENLIKIYGNDLSKYRDGTPVLIEKDTKKVIAIIRSPLKITEKLENRIQMDEWIRRRLDAKIDEEVTVRKTRFGGFQLFWNTMVLRHPDISQRWENFGILFAIITLCFDIFIGTLQWDFCVKLVIAVIMILAVVFLPPLILVPHE